MMFTIIAILFLSSAPVLVSSVQCNVCREGVRLNYTVTSSTVPPLPSDCGTIEAPRCSVSIFWELDFNVTYLEFGVRPGGPRDTVAVTITKGMERNNQTLSSRREVDFECDSSDKCNGPAGIQKVLSSLTVEDQFQQEIAPLLKIVSPFDPRAADCLYVHNNTFRCPPPDPRRCRRCGVEVGRQGSSSAEEVCATCEANESYDNNAVRFKLFVLSNPAENIDVAGLGCQLKGCNSAVNANRVFQASKITFNSDQYFNN